MNCLLSWLLYQWPTYYFNAVYYLFAFEMDIRTKTQHQTHHAATKAALKVIGGIPTANITMDRVQ